MNDLYLIGSLPGWLVALIAVVTVALLVQQFFGLKNRLPTSQTSYLTALRGLVYGMLIFFLFGPALIDKRVTKLRRPLTVLIDSSQSMGFPASSKICRSTSSLATLCARNSKAAHQTRFCKSSIAITTSNSFASVPVSSRSPSAAFRA